MKHFYEAGYIIIVVIKAVITYINMVPKIFRLCDILASV